MDKPDITYLKAIAADVDGILKIFAEVAPEVPTRVIEGTTKELVEGLVATGASLVAFDKDSKVVGYALAKGDGQNGIELVYLGVTGAARRKGVCSNIVARLKERGVTITASVRDDNKSSMAEGFKRLGFKVHDKPTLEKQTKFFWKPVSQQERAKSP